MNAPPIDAFGEAESPRGSCARGSPAATVKTRRPRQKRQSILYVAMAREIRLRIEQLLRRDSSIIEISIPSLLQAIDISHDLRSRLDHLPEACAFDELMALGWVKGKVDGRRIYLRPTQFAGATPSGSLGSRPEHSFINQHGTTPPARRDQRPGSNVREAGTGSFKPM